MTLANETLSALSVYALAFCSMNTADVVLGDTANISPAVFSAVALAVEITM